MTHVIIILKLRGFLALKGKTMTKTASMHDVLHQVL